MATAATRILFASGLCAACAPLWAAEWSLESSLGWEVDHASNRVLREGAPESQSAAATLDLALMRRTENGELTVSPYARLRRFTDDVQPDADDLRIDAAWRHDTERAKISFGAALADESTLTTELAETGEVFGDASRRTGSADFAWSFAHAEARQLAASVGFDDVAYHGAYRGRLYDYRYGAASLGETFATSERFAWTASTFASRLESPQRDGISSEQGVSLGSRADWTEHTSLTASLGVSRRDIDGDEGSGWTGNLALTHRRETAQWALSFAHNLAPYGSGVLTQRDSAELTVAQDLTWRWRVATHAGIVRNRDTGSGSTLDDRTYRYADTQLIWSATEHWALAAVASVANASDDSRVPGQPGVTGWSLAVRSTWTPARRVIGH